MTRGGSVRTAVARTATVAAIATMIALACGSDEPSSPPVRPSGEDTFTAPSPEPSRPPLGPPAVSASPDLGDGAVEFAIADVADRFGYDPDEVTVVSVEAVDWPNGALGCPQVDTEYEPGPVPGYRIVLSADGMTYQYHGAAGESEPFRCQFLD